LHVNQGELVALIGANGAGKSSSMKAIADLLMPSAGEIHFVNKETRKLPAYELVRLGLGMLPEGRGVFKRMTILESLQMGAYLKSNPNDIERKLEEVYSYFPRLKERLSQLAGTLSGGEQQMAAEPKLLLLDELSMGLSPIMVETIFDVVRSLSSSGMTILLVEQNARLALQMADRAYVMESGLITLS
jgi:branched-chain amino acid transport system ATP-binding protein